MRGFIAFSILISLLTIVMGKDTLVLGAQSCLRSQIPNPLPKISAYLNAFVSYTRQDPDPPQFFVPHFKQVSSIKAPK